LVANKKFQIGKKLTPFLQAIGSRLSRSLSAESITQFGRAKFFPSERPKMGFYHSIKVSFVSWLCRAASSDNEALFVAELSFVS